MIKNIYLMSNNLMSKVEIDFLKDMNLNEQRKFTMISQKSIELLKTKILTNNLKDITKIYSSNYFNALETAKIIAEEKDIMNIIADDSLAERLVGALDNNEYRFLKGMQEHDFNYKLLGGESINETKERIKHSLKNILKSIDENILVVTHNIAIMSLLTDFCEKGYNLDDRLILNYKDNVIFDGVFHEFDLICLKFMDNKLIDIERIF